MKLGVILVVADKSVVKKAEDSLQFFVRELEQEADCSRSCYCRQGLNATGLKFGSGHILPVHRYVAQII
jgi:hypothetical protein